MLTVEQRGSMLSIVYRINRLRTFSDKLLCSVVDEVKDGLEATRLVGSFSRMRMEAGDWRSRDKRILSTDE